MIRPKGFVASRLLGLQPLCLLSMVACSSTSADSSADPGLGAKAAPTLAAGAGAPAAQTVQPAAAGNVADTSAPAPSNSAAARPPQPSAGAAGGASPAVSGSASGGTGGDMAGHSAAAGASGAIANAGSGGASDTAGSGGAPAASSAVTVKDYEMRGPYTPKRLQNQGVGTIQGATEAMFPTDTHDDPSAFTLYFPENPAEGERFPLLTWGNGTFVTPAYYDELIEHIVSHGFVVVGANDSQVGGGAQMLKAVEWATAQAADSSSPIYNLVDTEHVGALGQSQGGSGTCNAGLDPRIDAIAPLSGVPLDGGAMFVNGLKIPAFFVNSADEDGSGTTVKDIYNMVHVPAIYGVTAGGNHNSYGDIADDPGYAGLEADDAKESRAGITAWFDWQLKGKMAVSALFLGADCGFCKGSTWKIIDSRGF